MSLKKANRCLPGRRKEQEPKNIEIKLLGEVLGELDLGWALGSKSEFWRGCQRAEWGRSQGLSSWGTDMIWVCVLEKSPAAVQQMGW